MATTLPPPPPSLTRDVAFNRWLVEVNAILEQLSQTPDTVVALQQQVAALQGQVNALSNTVQNAARLLNGPIAPVGGVGSQSDWYADTVAKHIYVKTDPVTWTQIV